MALLPACCGLIYVIQTQWLESWDADTADSARTLASNEKAKTCADGGAHSHPPGLGELVNALQAALCPGVAVRAYHAMDPDIAIQGATEVPLCTKVVRVLVNVRCSCNSQSSK